MKFAPIVLFTYDRPVHTRMTIEALLNNKYAVDCELFVYSDGAKNEKSKDKVEITREYLTKIDGFKSIEIIKRERNWGLANNIIDGVTEIVNKFGTVIVLEDDHVTSPFFLEYMNEALDRYSDNEKVASIHGYVYPCREELPDLFFIKGADCWGWATWKRSWDIFNPDGKYLLNEIKRRRLEKDFDFDFSYPYLKMLKRQIKGKNSSWAIRWYASAFLNDMYTLYPGRSFVNQIGMDGLGTHSTVSDAFKVQISLQPIDLGKFPSTVIESLEGKIAFKNFFISLLPLKMKCYRFFCLILSKLISLDGVRK